MSLRTAVFALSALGLVASFHSDLHAARRRPAVENFRKVNARAGGAPVLFDNTHAQTAGNADWTIQGGYSDFADSLRHHGFQVSSHDRGEIDAARLADVKVLIVPEPNTRFTPREIRAITAFVQKGGGLLAIGNHHGSDRNGDGVDSVKAWNELTPAMGIKFNSDKHYEDPLAGVVAGGQLGQGVLKIGCWAGSSLTVSGTARPEFKFNGQNGGNAFVATGTHGSGRVVAIGDSSPFDDGTGAPGDHLHDGYKQHDIVQFGLNSVNWLAGKAHEAADR